MQFPESEYRALTQAAALLDLSDRGRLCLVGADREKFLHGQITNDLLRLKTGEGLYAALASAKGRLEADLFVYKLDDELLLDFEPGLTAPITARLEKFIIAEDVQVVDVASHYRLFSLQGPKAAETLRASGIAAELPTVPLSSRKAPQPEGECLVIRNDRFGLDGFDLLVPTEASARVWEACERAGAVRVNREAAEIARIERGIPRFGIDMTGENLVPETGLENRAISYSKGCYIGQEVIARIRTYGQVAKALRLLRLEGEGTLPKSGQKLEAEGREVGAVTSACDSPLHRARVALAYVRKEANALGTRLSLKETGERAEVIALPGPVSEKSVSARE